MTKQYNGKKRQCKPTHDNTTQYNTRQYNTIQQNTIHDNTNIIGQYNPI